MLATPEERQRALQQFPPERQEQIRKQLAWFDGLPKARQAIEIRRIERFAELSPERRAAVRNAMQALNQAPPARRQAMRRALIALGALNASQRARRMNTPAFQGRFTPAERLVIMTLSDGLLPPL
jgi:ATPase subunit of ABC transporter with duplicated ATPase domains